MERWKCSEMDRKGSCGVRRDMWGWDYHRAEWALLCAKGRPSEQRPGDWHEHGCCEGRKGHQPGWRGLCLRERGRSKPNVGETGGLWFWLSRVSLGLQCPRSRRDRSWSGSGLEGVTGAHPSTSVPHSPLGFNSTLISTQFFDLKTPNDEPAWSLYKAVVLKLECASPPSGILFWMRIPGTCPPAHTQVLIP